MFVDVDEERKADVIFTSLDVCILTFLVFTTGFCSYSVRNFPINLLQEYISLCLFISIFIKWCEVVIILTKLIGVIVYKNTHITNDQWKKILPPTTLSKVVYVIDISLGIVYIATFKPIFVDDYGIYSNYDSICKAFEVLACCACLYLIIFIIHYLVKYVLNQSDERNLFHLLRLIVLTIEIERLNNEIDSIENETINNSYEETLINHENSIDDSVDHKTYSNNLVPKKPYNNDEQKNDVKIHLQITSENQ